MPEDERAIEWDPDEEEPWDEQLQADYHDGEYVDDNDD